MGLVGSGWHYVAALLLALAKGPIMPARRPRVPLPHEQVIRSLKSDLDMARRTIVDLVPEPARRILDSFDGDQLTAVLVWAEKAAGQIVDLCETVEQKYYDGYPLGAPRAVCPLCRGGSSTPYDKGFAVPEGLFRHLLGSHNSRQCDEFAAAFQLALVGADMRASWPKSKQPKKS